MALKDHYKTLGLEQLCTKDEVKKAYRMLAKKYHPDKNKGNTKFAILFIEITEAYNILVDDTLRKEYEINKQFSKETKSETTEKTNNSNNQNNTHQRARPQNSNIPEIISFDTNRNSFLHGEPITFFWEVKNADKVEITPYGFVNIKGIKTIKINNAEKTMLILKLVATNTAMKQFVSKTIKIPSQSTRKNESKKSSTSGWQENVKYNKSEPEIEYFSTNKNSFTVGQPINFFWKVKNADKIELHPFGEVKEIQIKSITEHNNIPFLILKLIATNTFTGKSISKIIEVPNIISKNYGNSKRNKNATSKTKSPSNGGDLTMIAISAICGVVGLISLIALFIAVVNGISGKIQMNAVIFVAVFLIPLAGFSTFGCYVTYPKQNNH